MNLLEFVDMGLLETLLLSVACLLAVLVCCGIGAIFVRGESNRIALRAVMGLSLVSVLVLFAASYCAAIARYIIYGGIAVSFVLVCRMLYVVRPSTKSIVRAILPSSIVYACFVSLWLSYIFAHEGTVDYNSHMIYCSAIPEEIFKADYSSRIRIVDVYPCEWSVYHLFNGCSTAIPLAVFPLKNIVTFNLAKFAVIAVMIGAIYESLVHRYGLKRALRVSVVILFVFIVCANRFTLFMLEINNYSSLLIMGILWVSMQEREHSYAAMLSMILAVATSKSTITGLLFFAYSLYVLFKEHRRSVKALLFAEGRTALYCLVVGIGCIVMVTSGDSPANEQLFHPDFVANMTHESWMGMFFFGDSLNAFIKTKEIQSLGLAVLMLCFYAIVLVMQRKVIMRFLRDHVRIILYAVLLISSSYVMYWMQAHDDAFVLTRRFFAIPLQFVFLFVLPIVCVFACSEKQTRTPLQLFVVFAFVQFMVLNADNSASNYCLLMFPLAFSVSECVTALLEKIPRRLSLGLYVALFGGAICYGLVHNAYKIFVWDDTDYYWVPVELSQVAYLGNDPFEYYDPSDAEGVMLNSLKGNRIHYNVKPDQRDLALEKLSMSMRFVSSSDYESYPSQE